MANKQKNDNLISQAEYSKRREKLMNKIGQDSIAIISAAPEYLRNGDAHFAYRQDSNFYYLTGFPEPHAVAVLIPAQNKYILFNQIRDPQLEIWIGDRIGQERAVQEYGANESYPIEQLDTILPELMANKSQAYFAIGRNQEFDNKIIQMTNKLQTKVRAGITGPSHFMNIENLIHEMRLIKSDAEISTMRTAAEISAQAHIAAMHACKHNDFEYQLEAVILQHLYANGCRAVAYNSIVGAGANACVLHYVANSSQLKSGDLLLIDAGGEYQNYAADITRTFPINGKFNSEQRSLYQLVLKAQQAAIDLVAPGIKWHKLQETIIEIITQGLCELGILTGKVSELIASRAYSKFYMHNSGHWLGLDVHDAGSYKIDGAWRELQAGMVLTVEPGIYITAAPEVAEKWWNIGIRIEDDVLVTSTGYEVLSKAAPKTVEEIEELMSRI